MASETTEKNDDTVKKVESKVVDKVETGETKEPTSTKTETGETKTDEGQKDLSNSKSSEIVSETEFNITSAKITNPDEIKKYDDFFRGQFYIPDYETGTYDDAELLDANYVKSAEKIGAQIHAIAVAIYDDDPTMKDTGSPEYNPESKFRIHGRVADGRHRYMEAVSSGITWRHEYYRISSFKDFMLLRSHMDSKKQQSKLEMENKFTQISEYYHQALGIPIQDVCNTIVKDFSPPYAPSSIRLWVPYAYKDHDKASRREGTKKRLEDTTLGKKILAKVDKKLSKKDQKIEKLNNEKNELVKENFKILEEQKVLEDSVKSYEDMAPFLTATHELVIEGTDIKVSVRIDLVDKAIIVKKL